MDLLRNILRQARRSIVANGKRFNQAPSVAQTASPTSVVVELPPKSRV